MEEAQKNNIQNHRDQLLTSMPPDHMKNKLIQFGILSNDEGLVIDAVATDRKKNEAILNKVLQSASRDAYQTFIKVLQTIPSKNNRLAELVDGCIQNVTDSYSYSEIRLHQKSINHNVTTSTANQSDVTRYFFDVADQLQEDWIKLSYKLDTEKKIDIESIKGTYSNDFDRADYFLCQWKDKYGDSATVRRLTSALKGIGKGDIAKMIGNDSTPSHSIILPTLSDHVDASTSTLTFDNTARVNGDPQIASQSVASTSAINNDPASTSDSEQLPESISLEKELDNKPTGLKHSHCKLALRKHWEKFTNVVPAYDQHFLSQLNHQRSLGDWYFEEINHMKHKKDKAQKLYDIFTNEREVDDFIKLCVILRKFPETQNFGKTLQSTAYKLCQ